MAIVRQVDPRFQKFWEEVDAISARRVQNMPCWRLGPEERSGLLTLTEKIGLARKHGVCLWG